MDFNEVVKSALRVKTGDSGINEEIKVLISAAQKDLQTAGVSKTIAEDTNNDLTKQAIIFYCKANFGYDNPDAARFNDMFQLVKNTMALTDDIVTTNTTETGDSDEV